jgi:hypothetical protein
MFLIAGEHLFIAVFSFPWLSNIDDKQQYYDDDGFYFVPLVPLCLTELTVHRKKVNNEEAAGGNYIQIGVNRHSHGTM